MIDQPEEIEGIKVTNEIKYLGIQVCNKKDLFQNYRKEKIKTARLLAEQTLSIISKSCNRMLVGKTYWKGVAVPAILYGSPVVRWRKKEIGILEGIQNSVGRKILKTGMYASTDGIRGEIGMSTMKTRINKSVIQYTRRIKTEGNEHLEEIMESHKDNNDVIHKYILNIKREYKIERNEGEMSKNEVNKIFQEADTSTWRENLEKKSTLEYYKIFKKEIKEVKRYFNDTKSELYIKARINSLPLAGRINEAGDRRICKLCKNEWEDLKHFLFECPKLDHVRREHFILQRPHNTTTKQIETMLFKEENEEEAKKIINKLWGVRNNMLKDENSVGVLTNPLSNDE